MDGKSQRCCFTASFFKQKNRKVITFLRDGENETDISYGRLDRDSKRMASRFQELDVEKSERVIRCIRKSLIFVVAHLALQKIGAICVPLNSDFKKSELDLIDNQLK